jgi:hypothetical protein
MKQYSFLNTILLVNGIEITGFDEGDAVINLTRTTDSADHKVGIDGEMTISVSADRSGSVSFKLMQTSNSNAYMVGLVTAMENGAFVPIFIQFKDTLGGDIGSGTQGYIKRPADMARGATASSQEWVVVTERLDLLHVGA